MPHNAIIKEISPGFPNNSSYFISCLFIIVPRLKSRAFSFSASVQLLSRVKVYFSLFFSSSEHVYLQLPEIKIPSPPTARLGQPGVGSRQDSVERHFAPGSAPYMYADQTEHEGEVEDSILRERRSGQDGIDSCLINLAESSSDEAERSEKVNVKLECEPTACLSTGIWRGCSLKQG